MCFYLYAPNHQICIKYSSELIHLEKDGTSTVTVDCLINSLSDEPIKTLRIIYPNRFYVAQNGRIKSKTPKIHFSDKSVTFITEAEEINFKSPEPEVQLLSPDQYSLLFPGKTIPAWAKWRILRQPDPSNPLNDIEFYGLVGGNNEFTIKSSSFTYPQLKILYDINNTVMTYEFREPFIGPRWIRLAFSGKNAAQNLDEIEDKFLKKITNTLYYQYQIWGPYDVKKNFITYLQVYRKWCEKYSSPEFINSIINLIAFFVNDGLIQNTTPQPEPVKYEKLFLHIDPGKMERLTDYDSQGDVIIAGRLPNSIPNSIREIKSISLYQWKVINEPIKDKFYFSLIFQTKPFTLLYSLVPWVAIIIAAIGILLRFLPSSTAVNVHGGVHQNPSMESTIQSDQKATQPDRIPQQAPLDEKK